MPACADALAVKDWYLYRGYKDNESSAIMKTAWWILTPLVIATFGSAAAILARRGFIPAAQSSVLVVLVYILIFIALWGMQSQFIRTSGVDLPLPVKHMLLAMTGGLLAQVLIMLDALVRGKLPQKRVAVLYVRGPHWGTRRTCRFVNWRRAVLGN